MGTVRPLFSEAVVQAEARWASMDHTGFLARRDDPGPQVLATEREMQARRRFLQEHFADSLTEDEIQTRYERIIAGNDLQDVNYLAKGVVAAKSVCRIRLESGGGGFATGFMISPNVLITNHHVFPDPDSAASAQAQFNYERDIDGKELAPVVFKLRPKELFYTLPAIDYSVVAVEPRDITGTVPLATFGYLPLIEATGKAAEGEYLTIVQHPAGRLKQVCVRENKFLRRTGDFLWYSTDTLAGSSGSPVFSNDWLVVALHHSGVPSRKNGVIQTVTGQDFDPRVHGESDIKWDANEGARVSRIIQTLREARSDHALVKPIVSQMGASTASVPAPTSQTAPIKSKQETDMARRITVQLEIGDDGSVRLAGGGAVESYVDEAKKGPTDERGNVIDAPADREFKGPHLKGYNPKLGSYAVLLPELDASISSEAAPLRSNSKSHELKYEHFSVVMNKTRRLAFFSAANVLSSGRHKISGRSDNWIPDKRISPEHQTTATYYSRNKLDRGHLTRREDMEFGTTAYEAVRSANGTCVFTNCVPQRNIFNQGKAKNIGEDSKLWAGLEQYILESVEQQSDVQLQVFTGPIFSSSDPEYRGQKIPLDFWKVVAGIAPGGALFATAYLLSQELLIDPKKLDEAEREWPLGAYLTYQRKVSEIEDETGLRFYFTNGAKSKTKQPLSSVDPLNDSARARQIRRVRRRRPSGDESFQMGDAFAITSFDDIVLK